MNDAREFRCDTVYFEQVHPLHHIFIPLFGGLHYAVFICLYARQSSSPLSIRSFPPPLILSQTVPHLHSWPVITVIIVAVITVVIILGLGSINEQEHAIFVAYLFYFC
jgi:hypothetical protein